MAKSLSSVKQDTHEGIDGKEYPISPKWRELAEAVHGRGMTVVAAAKQVGISRNAADRALKHPTVRGWVDEWALSQLSELRLVCVSHLLGQLRSGRVAAKEKNSLSLRVLGIMSKEFGERVGSTGGSDRKLTLSIVTKPERNQELTGDTIEMSSE